MIAIPATWMRGGTSKCWVFRREDLDIPGLSVDEVLLRLYGSPDLRQIDGVGGGTSTTSKAVILSPSTRPDIDVDYTFAQVGIDEAVVDWGSNCGNCSAVVAPYAVHAGWVEPTPGRTTVRVLNTNTGQVILQDVPTPDGRLLDTPTTAIPGVPGLGAEVRMGFVDPAGRSTGRLLPSGNPVDELPTPDGGRYRASLVDAGAPVVIIDVTQLGHPSTTNPHTVDLDAATLATLDDIRRAGAVAMGLAATPQSAARAVPKLAVVGATARDDADLGIQMLSMGTPHPAVPITGSVALTLAAGTPGTVVATRLASATPAATTQATTAATAQATAQATAPATGRTGLRLDTPAGLVETFTETRTDADGDHDVVGATRTYRRLCTGDVFLPADPAPLPTLTTTTETETRHG